MAASTAGAYGLDPIPTDPETLAILGRTPPIVPVVAPAPVVATPAPAPAPVVTTVVPPRLVLSGPQVTRLIEVIRMVNEKEISRPAGLGVPDFDSRIEYAKRNCP